MKRLFTITTALMLCIVILLSCAAQPGAVQALPIQVGDVDRDNDITVVDATLIQRFLADMNSPSELQTALSDADGDGDMSILDVTAIQRMLAGLPGKFVYAEINDWFIGVTSFHTNSEVAVADHYSTTEICYVGVPVVFSARVFSGAQPRRFMLSIDGETVCEVEAKGYEKALLTYTFPEEGEYVMSCCAECRYGLTTQSSRRIRAVSLPEDGSPAIMGAAFYDASSTGSGNSVLTVNAVGGTAPYMYNYTLYYDGLSPLCAAPDSEEVIVPEPAGSSYTTGYIRDNEINLNELFAKYVKKPSEAGHSDVMRVQITVRDAEGKESQPVTASYIGYVIYY